MLKYNIKKIYSDIIPMNDGVVLDRVILLELDNREYI